jgi:uncharacterized protein with PQ loop repeat
MVDLVGWLATAVFMTSYFAKGSIALRRIQGGAASLWALYGILIHASPVIVANVLVAGVAVATSFRRVSDAAPPASPTPG